MYSSKAAVVLLALAGCGGGGHHGTGVDATADAAGHDGVVDELSWDGGGTDGAIHVAWVLESAGGAPIDCISADTTNIEIAFTNASQIQALWSANYCVDMQETFGGLAPGDYSIQLSLLSNSDRSIVAGAMGTATVMPDRVAEAGTLTLRLPGP